MEALKKASDDVYRNYAKKNPKLKRFGKIIKPIWKVQGLGYDEQYYYLETSKELGITKELQSKAYTPFGV